MSTAPDLTKISLSAELARCFRRACEQLGRDAEDVFSEMLVSFLSARGIEAVVTGDGPLSPPPGPCTDPSQPHAHPFCHNASADVRERRLARRMFELDELLEGRTRQTSEGCAHDGVPRLAEGRRRADRIRQRLLAGRTRGVRLGTPSDAGVAATSDSALPSEIDR
jgi:hypothetical protein